MEEPEVEAVPDPEVEAEAEAEEEDPLFTTKTIVNSLVIPFGQNGVSLRKLCLDYKEIEGDDIPFNELGFNSLTAFLRSMSDLIEMRTESDGSTLLFSIGNKSTGHLIDMVAHQSRKRSKTPKSKRPLHPRRTSTPMDPRLAKRLRTNDNNNERNGSFNVSNGNNGNTSFGNSSFGNTPNKTNGSTPQPTPTKPYHKMTEEEALSLVTEVRKEVKQTSIEKAKNGIDSKLWAEIFDVQKVTDMKPLPIDTNGMLVAKANLRQPLKIGEYSLKISSRSDYRSFIDDASELKYLHLPPAIADISLDLNHGYDMVSDIHWGKPSNSKLDELLKWISLNRVKFKLPQELIPQNLNTDFVCYRGLLSKIMVSPYESNNRWLICATKFRGTIYLCEFHETYPPPDDYYNKLSFGGFRFEQYLVSYEADIPPDPNDFDPDHHEYCTVMRTRLNSEKVSHSLVFGAELDCVIPYLMEQPGFLKNFVELKTTKIMPNEFQYRSFLKHKLLKWWAQSYLVGVPLIVAGYKDTKNIVRKLERLNIESFPDLCAEFWSANVCLNFLNRFLNHVKEMVTIDDPNIVYQFAFQSQNDITCTRLTEPGDFQILPKWYIRELSK